MRFPHSFNKVSSMVNEPVPHLPHETIATPLIKSALSTGIVCLHFGHLYCLFETMLSPHVSEFDAQLSVIALLKLMFYKTYGWWC